MLYNLDWVIKDVVYHLTVLGNTLNYTVCARLGLGSKYIHVVDRKTWTG